ncbi:hypothetical protein CRG98_001226 [Punica granatum]|uniref:Uncharacterized protein n=1 Tax=Punica granatum TaxID=22663 RepID=A0A2I0LCJ1_PUNGR|nr:hypothetical protein CRG98_001226 [Punica granatum]
MAGARGPIRGEDWSNLVGSPTWFGDELGVFGSRSIACLSSSKLLIKPLLYGPECGLSSGPALRAFGSRGLGVSTFPWGRVTDTRERRSRHLSFYDPKVEGG